MVALLCACSTAAFTGRQQVLLYSDTEISALADDSYASFMDTTKLSANTATTKLVQTVGQKMAVGLAAYLQGMGKTEYLNGLSWEFKLVADQAVNAFCLPNGKIILYDGIMKYANNPTYVAVVIGHEMGHAIARHGNERMSEQAMIEGVGNVARQVLAGTQMGKSQTKMEVFDKAFAIGSNVGLLLPFSRKQEYEADEIGLYIMALAGYDVYQTPTFWSNMTGANQSSSFDFLSTHPADAKRIAAISEKLDVAATFYRESKE